MGIYFLILVGLAASLASTRGEFWLNWPTDWAFRWDIVSLRDEVLPCSLYEDDWVIEGPDIVNVLKLHIENFEIVGLGIFSWFPVFEEIWVYKSKGTIEEEVVTAFLDVDNTIVDEF